jgi:hypothetical protein
LEAAGKSFDGWDANNISWSGSLATTICTDKFCFLSWFGWIGIAFHPKRSARKEK